MESHSASALSRTHVEITCEMERIELLFRNSNRNFLVMGGAGTGKSNLLRRLVENSPKRVEVLAFTGLAALQVGGRTIHSFFGLDLGLQQRHQLRHRKPDFAKDEDRIRRFRELQCIFIDEVSMLRSDLFDAVDAILREHGPHCGEPFGGVQIGLFGDVLQLPPIVKDEEIPAFNCQWDEGWPSPWFMDALCFRTGNFQRVTLTKIFRQPNDNAEGIEFVKCLQRIRENLVQPEDLELLNRRVIKEDAHEGMALVPTNVKAESINTRRFNALRGEAKSFKGYYENWPRNWDKRDTPVPENVELKVGARVIVCANLNPRIVNGTIGEITELSDDEVVIDVDGIHSSVRRHTWEFPVWKWDHKRKTMVKTGDACFTQMPVKLAWAMTIHKAQGQTVNGPLRVDLGSGVWSGGQTYVALSRVRRLEQLHLSRPVKQRDVFAEPRAVQFLSEGDSPVSLEEIRAKAAEIYIETKQLRDKTSAERILAQKAMEHAEKAQAEAKLLRDEAWTAAKESIEAAIRAETAETRVRAAIEKATKANWIRRLMRDF